MSQQRSNSAQFVLLAVAVVAVSMAAPIVVACSAPALAIAFWRCALGSVATFSWLLLRRRWDLRGVRMRWLLLAGFALAVHFAAWIPSLRLTSVAAATALVATVPIWTALIARAAGRQIRWQTWLGIGCAMLGVLLLTGVNASGEATALIGDGLALLGGMAAAGYLSVGARARQQLAAAEYNAAVYGLAAGALLLLCLAADVQLSGYSLRDWVLIGLMTILAQLLGHSVVNVVLRQLSATVVGLALLLEVPGAILVAAVWLGQVPEITIAPAIGCILAGLAIVVVAEGRLQRSRRATTSP